MSKARNIAALNTVEVGATTDQTKSDVDALGIAATSVTGAQASAISANTSKTGITSAQASAITANTAKITYPSADSSKLSAVEVGATADQTKADIDALGIAATSVTGSQATAITAALPKAGGTMTGDTYHGDNVKAKFGASNDLEIFHDSANSVIQDVGTGSLILQTDGTQVSLQSTTEYFLTAAKDGAVTAYHNGAAKLATTSTGVDISGTVTADGLTLGDNDKAKFGASDDLQIYHDGSNSIIYEGGTGDLQLRGNGGNTTIMNGGGTATLANFGNGSSVDLYHNNAKKLATTATGIDVTGTVTADGLTLGDNEKATFGAGGDLEIYHDGGTSHIRAISNTLIIESTTGDVQIRPKTGEKALECNDDGSVKVYYDGSPKLATTSTGVDVTGTVTADGLHINTASPTINFTDSDNSLTSNINANSANLTYSTYSTSRDHIFKAGSNTLVTMLGDGNVGIGVTVPASKLHIVGDAPYLTIGNNTEDNAGIRFRDEQDPTGQMAYIQHTSDAGNNLALGHDGIGDSLIISSAGIVTKPRQPAFHAKLTAQQNLTSGTVRVGFNTEMLDTGNNFVNGVFTAPVAGAYQINCTLSYDGGKMASDDSAYYGIYKNGAVYAQHIYNPIRWSGVGVENVGAVSAVVNLAAGDTCDIRVAGVSQTPSPYLRSAYCHFSGHLIG